MEENGDNNDEDSDGDVDEDNQDNAGNQGELIENDDAESIHAQKED